MLNRVLIQLIKLKIFEIGDNNTKIVRKIYQINPPILCLIIVNKNLLNNKQMIHKVVFLAG